MNLAASHYILCSLMFSPFSVFVVLKGMKLHVMEFIVIYALWFVLSFVFWSNIIDLDAAYHTMEEFILI